MDHPLSSVKSSRLKGHKRAINDVTSSNSSFLIATGSDDGTVRIWDQRLNKSVLCYKDFFSSAPLSVRFAIHDEHFLFAVDDTGIYQLDTRSDSVLVRTPHNTIDRSGSTAEIDALAICSSHFAVGDDDGTLSVFDASTGLIVSSLYGCHTNLIGSICLESPQPDRHIIYSGGFDGRLVRRDILSRIAPKTFDFSQHCPGTTNPPFVHSLCLLSLEEPDDVIVCALGNGMIYLLSSRNLTPVAGAEASGGMVSSLFSAGRMVISAGNSGVIKLWDISTSSTATEASLSGGSKKSASERRRIRRKQGGASHEKTTTALLEYDLTLRYDLPEHRYKVNAITGSIESGDSMARVYVADTSSDLTLYSIPI